MKLADFLRRLEKNKYLYVQIFDKEAFDRGNFLSVTARSLNIDSYIDQKYIERGEIVKISTSNIFESNAIYTFLNLYVVLGEE